MEVYKNNSVKIGTPTLGLKNFLIIISQFSQNFAENLVHLKLTILWFLLKINLRRSFFRNNFFEVSQAISKFFSKFYSKFHCPSLKIY